MIPNGFRLNFKNEFKTIKKSIKTLSYDQVILPRKGDLYGKIYKSISREQQNIFIPSFLLTYQSSSLS